MMAHARKITASQKNKLRVSCRSCLSVDIVNSLGHHERLFFHFRWWSFRVSAPPLQFPAYRKSVSWWFWIRGSHTYFLRWKGCRRIGQKSCQLGQGDFGPGKVQALLKRHTCHRVRQFQSSCSHASLLLGSHRLFFARYPAFFGLKVHVEAIVVVRPQ